MQILKQRLLHACDVSLDMKRVKAESFASRYVKLTDNKVNASPWFCILNFVTKNESACMPGGDFESKTIVLQKRICFYSCVHSNVSVRNVYDNSPSCELHCNHCMQILIAVKQR